MKKFCASLVLYYYFILISNSTQTAADSNRFGQQTLNYQPLVDSSAQVRPYITNSPASRRYTCEPEIFQHDYIVKGKFGLLPVENSWHRARPGELASLVKVCLMPNGVPVTRKCEWDAINQKAVWEPLENWKRIKCLNETREKIVTPQLNALHDELQVDARHTDLKRRLNIIRRMRNVLEQSDYQILPADVLSTTQILAELSNQAQDMELTSDIVGICSTLTSSNSQALRISAVKLNATNEFLKTFETYMDSLSNKFVPKSRCGIPIATSIVSRPSEYRNSSESVRQQNTVETIDFSHLGVSVHLTENVSVFFINPECAKITGISIYDTNIRKNTKLLRESHGHFFYRFIYMNETVAELMKEPGVQVATFLPENIWKYVKTMTKQQAYIVIKIYDNDALFVDTSAKPACKTSSKIISISIPGFSGYFQDSLLFVLRNKYFKTSPSKSLKPGTGCCFWNYTTWIYSGVETKSQNLLQEPVILCSTKHLTQFSFLLGGTYKQTDFGDSVLISLEREFVLDIISLVGCSLSLLGLLGIWMTAALFKIWRSIASTKVLLNMCVALTLQMVLFVFVNTDDMSEQLVKAHAYTKCVALGAILQYSILVLFSWMLIIAYLQFQRYVTIIGVERPNHYILKSAVAAWGFPFIPTLLVAFIEPDSYIPTPYQLRTDTGICYPSGNGLIFGVMLPVTLICIVNLIIFIYVFYSISHTLNQTLHQQEKKLVIKQIRLSILLFFLLGLSWIFGIFAFMHAGIAFSYLFCLTATLQGFVLFLYFVLFDEVPRRAWKKLLCPHKHELPDKKSRELQSMTASTGVENGSVHH